MPGLGDRITGRLKKAAGDLVDDPNLREQGAQEERKAEAKEELAQAQQKADRAAEEVARSNGYSKPDEKVYVVAEPTSAPLPLPAPAVHVQQASPSFGDALRAWWGGLLRRL